MIDFLKDNSYIKVENHHLSHQCNVICIDSNYVSLLFNSFLYSYEAEFQDLKKSSKKSELRYSSHHTDDSAVSVTALLNNYSTTPKELTV